MQLVIRLLELGLLHLVAAVGYPQITGKAQQAYAALSAEARGGEGGNTPTSVRKHIVSASGQLIIRRRKGRLKLNCLSDCRIC